MSLRTRAACTALPTALAVAVGMAGCTAGDSGGAPSDSPARSSSAPEVLPASEVQPLVEAITKKTVKKLPTTRLAEGLAPPTNRWFSGMVFGDEPQPVFPLPLSFGLTDSGFAFGLPEVTSTEKAILGGYKPDLTVTTGAKSAQVSAYDTLSVTVDSLTAGGDVLGHTTIAQGSPFVSYRSEAAGELSTPMTFTSAGDFWTAKAGATTYGLVVQDGSVSGGSVQLEEGGTATWFAVPADGSAEKLAALAGPVDGTSVGYEIDGDESRTTLSYGKSETAFAARPHQQPTLAKETVCDLGTYPSIYGALKVCSGTELSWTAPVSAPTAALDLSKISDGQAQQLSDQVTKDIAELPAFPADTYFGGKALYRAAMLYRLATQLELTAPAAEIKGKLAVELTKWTQPKGCQTRPAFCFVYDEEAKGIVGLTPSFGSDEFNDHHFHYGYFLYAAGVLAADDAALAQKWAPVMDLLAADIGSSSGTEGAKDAAFPDRRVFDAYAGHSWASGTAPFADGNNQESSSEAVTAWTGLALWGKARDNAALETQATWMLSTEAQSGLAYWTNFATTDPVYSGYGHKIVPLNWGGKRDYATWFSPEPAAMLGILVIPMSPASTYLAGDPARIEANVAEATSGRFDQKFGDYLLMYSALAGKKQQEAALAQAEKLDSEWIDDGNSRSYLLAWLMAEHS